MTITLRSSRRETPHDLACSPLAVVLMIEIRNLEDVDGLKRASLSALRPQLVGAIAEDADRVLAEEKETRDGGCQKTLRLNIYVR